MTGVGQPFGCPSRGNTVTYVVNRVISSIAAISISGLLFSAVLI